MGLEMEQLEELEVDAGLGNGGLGRLAGEGRALKSITTSQNSTIHLYFSSFFGGGGWGGM